MLRKNCTTYEVKADDQTGTIEAIVSVFTNVDHGGERVRPGAFTKSLERKLPKGVWAHDWKSPIAKTLEARQLEPGDELLPDELKDLGGLYIKGQFNLETQRGREAYSDLKFGTVDEFSIGYVVLKDERKAGVRDLVELDLIEWSPILAGMNPGTRLLGVKGKYLGAYIEPSMAMAAVSRANDALFYRCVYDCLYDEETSLAEKLDTLSGAIDEFRDLVLKVVEAILSAQAEEDVETAGQEIKRLWAPETKDAKGGAPAAQPYRDQLSEALAAVQGCLSRGREIHAKRAPEGRTLGAESLTAIAELSTELRELHAECKAAADAPGAGKKAATQFLLTEARCLGVPV